MVCSKCSKEFSCKAKRYWCTPCSSAATKAWLVKQPIEVRARIRAQQAEYKRKRKEQRPNTPPKPTHCECCRKESKDGHRQSLVWDHNHTTGLFRGWICHNCNSMLGHAKDNPQILSAGILYLERNAV